MRRAGVLAALAALACAPAAHGGQIEAGAAVVDETWHVGASAGQYASTRYDDPASNADIAQEIDPFAHQVKPDRSTSRTPTHTRTAHASSG